MSETDLKRFTGAYIKCALWCGILEATDPDAANSMVYGKGDYDGTLQDKTVSEEDLSPECRKQMEKDCVSFCNENSRFFQVENLSHPGIDEDANTLAGHHFWLTRNRHGAGFLDGDWKPSVAKELADKARRYGEVTLILAENGKIEQI